MKNFNIQSTDIALFWLFAGFQCTKYTFDVFIGDNSYFLNKFPNYLSQTHAAFVLSHKRQRFHLTRLNVKMSKCQNAIETFIEEQ